MNKLAFDPHKQQIDEWEQFYINFEEIEKYIEVVDRNVTFLNAMKSNNIRKLKSKISFNTNNNLINFNSVNQKAIQDLVNVNHQENINRQEDTEQKLLEKSHVEDVMKKEEVEPAVARKFMRRKLESLVIDNAPIVEVQKQKQQKQEEDKKQQIVETNGAESTAQLSSDNNKIVFKHQNHLDAILIRTSQNFRNFLQAELTALQTFISQKLSVIYFKFEKVQDIYQKYMRKKKESENSENQLAHIKENVNFTTILQNLFIEVHYLSKMGVYNREKLQEYLQKIEDIVSLTNANHKILTFYKEFQNQFEEQLLKIEKMQLKLTYFHARAMKGLAAKQITNPKKSYKYLIESIALNVEEYKHFSTTKIFLIGLLFGMLVFTVIAILIFKFVNSGTFEQSEQYLANFQIWRGCSYFIYFNWVVGAVLLLYNRFKINYKLITIQHNEYIPRGEDFIITAAVLTSTYLILFGVYLLNELGILFTGNASAIGKLHFIMWGINLVFLLNPFKVLNYQGRRYFLKLFANLVGTICQPMTMNIFFLAIILLSFIQPWNDFAFTICKLVHGGESTCQTETIIATFGYTSTLFIYRIIQSIRSHLQFGEGKRFSRPILGLIASCFSLNTVTSSFLYNLLQTDGLFVYWVISACISTCTGINADMRADWGLVSFDEEDPILRRYKCFPRKVYFIFGTIDIILNIGWVLIISNNIAVSLGILPIYFFMILTYVELARKGLWMFFRMEDDHAQNKGNYLALIQDNQLYHQLSTQVGIKPISELQDSKLQSKSSVFPLKEQTKVNIHFEAVQDKLEGQYDITNFTILKKLKASAEIKQKGLEQSREYIEEIDKVLSDIQKFYEKLGWQDEF